jgi:outer membrane protein assembly factor BamD (BamD/ComL family)
MARIPFSYSVIVVSGVFFVATLLGCQSLGLNPAAGTSYDVSDQSAANRSAWSRGFDSTIRFLTLREQINRDRAIELYRQGDELFREASKLPREQAKDDFYQAAKLFKRAADALPGSALEQDALMMQGESYYFADYLNRAEDAYAKLQKNHPRSRHSDRAGSRLFAISNYWIDCATNPRPQVLPVNFTDRTRPILDTSGHAIRVLDQMRYDDPTGKLADDATMAAAVENMRKGDYFEADQLLTDLREIYPDSEHQFNAHTLGLRCKLAMYAGADYSGLALEEAKELIERTRRLFPQEMRQEQHSTFVAQTAAEVEYRLAEKLWERARYREKQHRFGGANVYLQELLEKYPDTPFAEEAREHLATNSELPPVPPQRFAFLAKLFPEGQPQKPLMSTDGTILRR